MKKKYLVIAAHPDDETLGCGASIHSLIKNNNNLRVVFLGEGSTCRFGARVETSSLFVYPFLKGCKVMMPSEGGTLDTNQKLYVVPQRIAFPASFSS